MPSPVPKADHPDLRFALLCVGVWLHATDTLVTATIAPAITQDLGGIAYINWTIALYEVGALIAGAATAVLCVRFGAKRTLLGAALLYGGACLLAALAPNMALLLAARLLQGAGGGILLSLCYVAIEAWYARTLWNRLFSIIAVIWAAGSLLGPLLGGLFAELGSWRGAFGSFAGVAFALYALAALYLPAQARREAAPAWPLVPLLLLSLGTLLVAFAGVAASTLYSALDTLAGLALLYCAAQLDRRAATHLLPAQLLTLRHPVGAGLLMVFALSAGTTGFWAYGPLLAHLLFGISPLVSGYILAGEALAWSFATLAVASATPAADQPLIRGGTLLIALGAAGFALTLPLGSLPGMTLCALLQGAGFGMSWPSLVNRIIRLADPAEKSLAAAAPATVQRIGYAVGTAAAGLAANGSGLAAGATAVAAQTTAFWVFAAFIPLLLIGTAAAWRFTRTTA